MQVSSVLATVIANRYALADTAPLADAVEDLCSPNDNYGWSSSGVYCFWNVDTKAVLYVGLAIDLPLRFRQHNGLAPCPEECCKRAQIAAHFQFQAQLGYSVLLQSKMSQAITHRWDGAHPGQLEWIAENFGYFDAEEVKDDLNCDIVDGLRRTEGALILAHKKDHGAFPPWNSIGGATLNYAESQIDCARYFLRSLTRAHAHDDPLTARCTFRELSEKSIWERYEMLLHAARLHSLVFKTNLQQSFAVIRDGFDDLPRIAAEKYLAKLPAF